MGPVENKQKSKLSNEELTFDLYFFNKEEEKKEVYFTFLYFPYL